MLNIEKYKDQILNIHKEKWLSIECAIGTVRGVHLPCNQKCSKCEHLSLIWLSEEAKEPILDEVEKSYLSAVIKPFRKKVMDVVKIQYSGGRQSIRIRVSYGDCAELPFFKNNTMYKGMEVGKYYTPEELGL